MYLFLSALSVSEILVTVTIMLRMLDHLLSTHHSITFVACATQIFSFKFGYAHSFLLMVMDYDHYVAICYSLHYSALLSPTCYAHPVAWSWAGGSVMGMIMTSVVYHLTFVSLHVIYHILCHVFSLFNLACGDKMDSVTMDVILVCVIP